MNKLVKEEIEKLVSKYQYVTNNVGLFRAELEYIALIAEKEQMKSDYKTTKNIMKAKI